jgi:hemerythrin
MYMPLFDWKETYSVEIKELDDQHKKLFEIINRLYDEMRQSQAMDKIEPILKELSDYAAYHFKTEEDYFIKFKYEDLENHIREHLAYKQKINDYLIQAAENNRSVPFTLLDFLSTWWVNHIIGTDHHYIKCFHDHGIN